jgi:hypothetical protein
MSGRGCARLAAVAMTIAIAAPAAATCWSETERDAAKIRDLQSRLMVATLRCQAAGHDVTAAYNRFVVANRSTLRGVNRVLLTQFQADAGERAQSRYDGYATALANAYGGDATNRSVCANTARLADEAAAAAGNVARLVALQSRVGLAPPTPGALCTGRPPVVSSRAEAPAEGLDWLRLD